MKALPQSHITFYSTCAHQSSPGSLFSKISYFFSLSLSLHIYIYIYIIEKVIHETGVKFEEDRI